MSTPFLGELRMFAGNFAPANWAFCNGQQMSIAQWSALFALIGTTYGGDGVTTFNLPNLQSRIPVGQGSGAGLTPRSIGQVGGEESVTLTSQTMPVHNHQYVVATANSTIAAFTAASLPGALVAPGEFYATNTTAPLPTLGTFVPSSMAPTGGSLPHDNIMPSLCVNFIIALQGVFPTRN